MVNSIFVDGIFRSTLQSENQVYARVRAVVCVALAAVSVYFKDARLTCLALAVPLYGLVMRQKSDIDAAAEKAKMQTKDAFIQAVSGTKAEVEEKCAGKIAELEGLVNALNIEKEQLEAECARLIGEKAKMYTQEAWSKAEDRLRKEFVGKITELEDSVVKLQAQVQLLTEENKKPVPSLVTSERRRSIGSIGRVWGAH